MVAQQLANVEEAMDRLIQKFETDTEMAFVLDDKDREKPGSLPRNYGLDEVVSLWKLQTRHSPNSTAGLRRYLNPPVRHVFPQFDGPRGARSHEIVDDANLRHLLGCHTQDEVNNALRQFDRFDPSRRVRITDADFLQTVVDDYGTRFIEFTKYLPGLKKFGGLKLFYASHQAAIRYPERDSVLQSLYRFQTRVQTDCVFSARFQSSNQQTHHDEYDSFGLLALELKNVQVRATAGLHLSGYCRPGTDDQHGVQTILNELNGDVRRYDSICKKFRDTVTQAFQSGVLNKCGLVAMMDPAGMTVASMNGDRIDGLNEALAALRLGQSHRQEMTVNYDNAYCMHWEDGSFWKDLTCALVNQLYAEFPELRDCLDRYSALQHGVQVQGEFGRYRTVRRDITCHMRANRLFERCGEHYHFAAPTNARKVLEPLGEFVEREFGEHEILQTFHEFEDDVATSVYKVALPSVNNGRPFIAKLHHLDHQGEGLFVNELKIYHHLMSQNGDPRLWPLLLEFGLAFVRGMPFYYLALEYLDGEEPNFQECTKCSNDLTRYGIAHGDVKKSNFIKVQYIRHRVVKAIDFGISSLVPVVKDKAQSKAAPRMVNENIE